MTDSTTKWDVLGTDLTELILSYLPIPSIVRASSVCKLWNSIVHSHSFKTRIYDSRRSPWFFLCGQNNAFSKTNYQVFAFDPESDYWIKLPDTTLLSEDWFTVSNGFFFSFKPVLSRKWCQTSPLRFSRHFPLIGVCNEPECSKRARLIVVLADAEGCWDVEIYNPDQDSWEVCPPFPEIFRHEIVMCSAIFKGKLYVFSSYSGFVSCFDLKKRLWSDVRTLRPPGVRFSYLISCCDGLVLGGWCSVNDESEFVLWRVDERSLEFSEIGIMPQDLVLSLFDDGDQKFERLKLVGSGNLVYIFNEEAHWFRSICVCDMSDSGKCRWRRVPNLAQPVNGFQLYANKSAFVPIMYA